MKERRNVIVRVRLISFSGAVPSSIPTYFDSLDHVAPIWGNTKFGLCNTSKFRIPDPETKQGEETLLSFSRSQVLKMCFRRPRACSNARHGYGSHAWFFLSLRCQHALIAATRARGAVRGGLGSGSRCCHPTDRDATAPAGTWRKARNRNYLQRRATARRAPFQYLSYGKTTDFEVHLLA